MVLRGLIDPLWLPILVLAAMWIVLWRRGSLRTWMKVVGTSALAWIWFVATPFGALVLESPLVVESELPDGWQPEVIYVLSAGFDISDEPEGDVPSTETQRRVNRAVWLWRDHPSATLVMAGTEPGKDEYRTPTQLVALMKREAMRLGVPSERIVLDAVSTNTNGHAKVARDSGLHDADASIAVVSSDFHLRRARHEFTRFFTDVRMVGSDPAITDSSFGNLGIRSFFPQVGALRMSGDYLREYAGLTLSDFRN